jgi:DNA excision repair protein ERCC-4
MRRRVSADATLWLRWLFHLIVDLWLSPPHLAMQEIVFDTNTGGDMRGDAAHAVGAPAGRCVLRVDFSERNAALLDLARRCGEFDVRMEHLTVGDYFIGGGIIVERKTYADFAMSLADGRLFPQAAALARSPHRPVVLLEGPRPSRVPDVHPHALKGAMVSLAVMWRLPVLCARDPEDSLRILCFLAHQLGNSDQRILRRYDRKPKRAASRKLYLLQGLPGVGPAMAHRLLIEFGSVERVVTASEAALMRVRGLGPKKTARIRELVC